MVRTRGACSKVTSSGASFKVPSSIQRNRRLSADEKQKLRKHVRLTCFKLLMMETCEKAMLDGEPLGDLDKCNATVLRLYKSLNSEERSKLDERAKKMKEEAKKLLKLKAKKRIHAAPKLRTLCSPSMLNRLNEEIRHDATKVESVVEMGFGGLLNIASKTLPLGFCLDLVECFDPDQRCLKIPGKGNYTISAADVAYILGIPNGDVELPGKWKIPRETRTRMAKEYVKSRMTLGDLRYSLVEFCECNSSKFCEAFLVYVLGIYLMPTTSARPIASYVHYGFLWNNPKRYNWAEGVLKCLCSGIKKIKRRRVRIQNDGNEYEDAFVPSMSGCVHLLLLFYVHKDDRGVLLEDQLIQSCESPIAWWTDDTIRERIAMEGIYKDGEKFEDEESGTMSSTSTSTSSGAL